MGPRIRRTVKLCCPACQEELLDLDIAYANHGVTIADGKIHTHRGEVRAARAVQLMTILLLESYPNAVHHQSLLSIVEDLTMRERTEYPLESLHVQISKVRKPLAEIGLSFMNIYAVGYRLVIEL